MLILVTLVLVIASLFMSVPTVSFAGSGGHCGEKANDCNNSHNGGNGR